MFGYLLAISLIVSLTCPLEGLGQSSLNSRLVDLWKQSRRGKAYRDPSSYQLYRFEGGLREAFGGKSPEVLEQQGWRWARLGGASGVISLTDPLNRGWGGGFFRPRGRDRIMLQAPHTFFDQLTGTIGLKLFLEAPNRTRW